MPKASFSSSMLLREAIVIVSSSVARETVLHDLPLRFSLLDSHCSSLTIFQMDFHDLSRFYRHWNEALGLLLFRHWVDNIQSGFRDWGQSILDRHLREGPVIFRKVLKLRVTIFSMTFFYSDLRVRTLTFSNAWILSLRTKHLLVGCAPFCGRDSSRRRLYVPVH